MIEIRLPKPGPEIEEATITTWERSEGDKIESGDILAIIKTSIGSFKVAAEEEGILENILQATGATINFDEPIAVLKPEVAIHDHPDLPEDDESTLPLPIEEEVPEDEPVEEEDQEKTKLKLKSDELSEEPEEQSEEIVEEPKKKAKISPNSFVAPDVEISPAARKIAERMGIDLSEIKGSGEDGKILYIDIENAVNELEEATEEAPEPESLAEDPVSESESSTISMEAIAFEEEIESPEAPSEAPETPPVEQEEQVEPTEGLLEQEAQPPALDSSDIQSEPKAFPDFEEISIQFHLAKKDDLIIPFNTTKKAFSEKQSESNSQVPHFHLFAEVDFTEAKKWRKDYQNRHNVAITITDMLVKVCGHALALMPEMNAFVRADRIILKRSINIGVTTSVDEGVVTPVVPDVYHKSLNKVSEVIKKNTSLAMESKVVIDYDTTFTVSNLGMYGVKRFVPLITPPQTASLAIGEVQKKVVPVDDFIGIRSVMELTLSCDHRAIDGTTAARFMQIIRRDIENLREGEDPDWIKGNEQLRLI